MLSHLGIDGKYHTWDEAAGKYQVYNNPGGTLLHEETAVTSEDAYAAEGAYVALYRDNEAAIKDQAESALQTNRDFIALASPTNAQAAAQIKALSRQNNRIIRLLLRRFDAQD